MPIQPLSMPSGIGHPERLANCGLLGGGGGTLCRPTRHMSFQNPIRPMWGGNAWHRVIKLAGKAGASSKGPNAIAL